MATKNKVKFGLKNVYYAVATFDDDGEVTYATPVHVPGAVSLSMDAEGDNDVFYADDVAYYTLYNNSGYTGDLEMALITDEFRKDCLGEEEDSNGVLYENAENAGNHFALLFEFSGDVKKIRHVLYNCTAGRPSIASNTIEEEKEVQTETLDLTATSLINGLVKAKTGDGVDSTSTTYTNWYDKVYLPVTSEASEASETSDESDDDAEA